jgi:hypothetical protein
MSSASRGPASIVLTVIGSLLLLAGTVLFYARDQIIATEPFADKAESALEDDEVRTVVSREIVVNLIDRGSTDLVAGRPVLESVVNTVVDTGAFRKLFRQAAVEANRVFFVRDRENFVFDLADGSEIVRFGLKSVSPELAKQVPKDLDVTLLSLKRREFARSTLGAADELRTLGLLVPLLALLMLAAAIAIAPDRRIGVLRVAIGVAAAGVLLAVALLVLLKVTLAGVYGEDELSDEDVRGAVGGILVAFFGKLFSWGLLLGFTGLVVAGAAASLDPSQLENPSARLRERLTRRPRTGWGLAARGVGAIAVGFIVAFESGLAVQVIALLAGAYLVFFGTSELLVMLQGPEGADAAAPKRRRRTLLIAGAAAAAIVVVVAVSLLVFLDSADDPAAEPLPTAGCNGSVELCLLPLNEVIFAGTHNSFSAADSPGWLIANQRRTIERQLQDGVRLFLIDPHWGVEGADGRVRTDFEAEGRDRNRVAKNLPPNVLAAAERLTGRLGLRENEGGERELFLCHTTCELGATRMSESLDQFRDFLERNPGEVVILFAEPYMPADEIEQAFKDADLDRYVETLRRDEPMPTLGQLVRKDRRLIVFTEADGGDPPWYMDGFSFIQDTPLGATETDQLTCELNRGDASSPLLMLNHWADVFPPQRSKNEDFQSAEFLAKRIRRCQQVRGQPVNLIAVDHYDLGSLVEVVDETNAARAAAAAGP